MPAGKMVKYVPRKRSSKRKASGFRKAVTAIAKKAVMTQVETKTAQVSQNVNFGSNGTILPLWNTIVKGDGQENREGDVIRSLGVKLRGYVSIDPATVTANYDLNAVRLTICSGKRPLTSGDFPNMVGAIDPEVTNILYDGYINFTLDDRHKYFQKYIKFDRKVQYEATGGGVTKNELYVFMRGFGGTGHTTLAGNQCNIGYQLYYKDP